MASGVKMIQCCESHMLGDGMAIVRYVGMGYPQSQWTCLSEDPESYNARCIDIGHLVMQYEGAMSVAEAEKRLLSMARQHGAHKVIIEYRYVENIEPSKLASLNFTSDRLSMHIYARCQRIYLDE